ncbi:uncharacterized protein A4U43_C04F31440 [Asparagus officinalis]|uniref:At1g68980-like TPR repeats domain-containing protein n=1 Tax=Asparagus officinalis TaxID=4686 RepID=A0A5P1F6R0_ASPOF|nr:uncharacterized protein A4U43_C04F31440 [Asparagus officinalis]
MRGFSGLSQLRRRCSLFASASKVNGATNGCRSYQFHSSINNFEINSNPSSLQHLSTSIRPGVLWEHSSYDTLLKKLEISMENGSEEETLEAFNNFRRLHGFPNRELVNKMVVSFSYSSDRQWLRKAYDLVLLILDKKPNVLYHDSLSRLALTLARAQMPIPASTVLRVILEKFKLPPIDSWNILFSHLVKTKVGSFLASEILIEFCEFCLKHKSDGKISKQNKVMYPSTIMFNLVLSSCLQFKSSFKAQHIIEIMSQSEVVADASTIVIIARIYEICGQRDELKKLQAHIDAVSSVLLTRHYREFYDSLLSLHFKFNDLDSASELVLDLYRRPKFSHPRLQKHCVFQIGSSNLNTGSKIVVDPSMLQKDLIVDTQSKCEFVLFVDGKLLPSNKALAKLVDGYVKEKNVTKLSKLLIDIQKEVDSEEATLCSDVIDACIHQSWLETAHDIIDDLESATIPVQASTYESLLRSYIKDNMLDESELLLKQMKTAGHYVNLSDENTLLNKRTEDLVALIDRETRENSIASSMIYEFNNSILFFCKAKMMDDALKTFNRMQQKGIQPTVETFSHLVKGYSSLKMYRQITILWGETRRRIEDQVLMADRDLLDCFLCNFIQGGYFERVMDIVNYMLKNNMFTDTWKYKREFLKLHSDLYWSLKASDARTDAQK